MKGRYRRAAGSAERPASACEKEDVRKVNFDPSSTRSVMFIDIIVQCERSSVRSGTCFICCCSESPLCGFHRFSNAAIYKHFAPLEPMMRLFRHPPTFAGSRSKTYGATFAFDLAKSPAFTIVILSGVMYLRTAALICSGVKAFILLSRSASQAMVRFWKR